MLSGLRYAKYRQRLEAKCFPAGVELIRIKPSCASTIGAVMYTSRRGWSVHAAVGVIARRGQKLTECLPRWHASSGTVLEFAESLGVPLPNGCRVGQCESCTVTITKGSATHLHGAEPDDPNVMLACQPIPISDLIIDA